MGRDDSSADRATRRAARGTSFTKERKALLCLALLALSIRLLVICLWPEGADTAKYRRVAEALAQGGGLYWDTPGLYPYPPPWAGVELAALRLSESTAIPFVVWVKLLPVAADIGITCLLYACARGMGRPALLPAAVYALNPVPILVTAMQGQFDAVMIFFLLLACYTLVTSKRPYWAAASLMVAVALKSLPLLFLPLFLFRIPRLRHRVGFAAVVAVPLALMMLPFCLADPASVWRELFSYQGFADHGWLAVLRQVSLLRTATIPSILGDAALDASKYLFAGLYLVILLVDYRRRHEPSLAALASSCALVFVAFYVGYAGLCSQYLLWALPFLILASSRSILPYTALTTLALVAFYTLRWPEILYRARIEIASEGARSVVYLLSTLLWWLWCCGWLFRHGRRDQGGHPFSVGS